MAACRDGSSARGQVRGRSDQTARVVGRPRRREGSSLQRGVSGIPVNSKSKLYRSKTAMNKNVSSVPEGFSTITPYLAVPEADKLLNFLTQAFDAVLLHRHLRPDGKIAHAALRIGNSTLMLGRACPQPDSHAGDALFLRRRLRRHLPPRHRFRRRSIMEPQDQYYGDRSGAVDDPAGNQWWIATHKEDMSEAELEARIKKNRQS